MLGRELLSGGVPTAAPGSSKTSSKGEGLPLLAFQSCRRLLSLLCEDELFWPGDAALSSSGAVMAEASDPEAALSALQVSCHIISAVHASSQPRQL